MHAQFIGSPALIPFFVSQHGQNEHPLKLPHGFLESRALSIHLQYKIFEFRLHSRSPNSETSMERPGKRLFSGSETNERGERNMRKEKAVTLVML
jgi:hypothetical protein